MGVVSKQTVAERLGYDWESEQERITEQQEQEADLGVMALRQFDRTGGNLFEMMGRGGPNMNGGQRQPVAR